MDASFTFPFGSRFGRQRRPRPLEPQDIDDGQDAGGIEDGQTNEQGPMPVFLQMPCFAKETGGMGRQLIVTRALPQGDQFPDRVPDGHQDDDGNQHCDYGSSHKVDWFGCLIN